MEVITMWHDGDFIGVAKDYYSAITFLINRGFIAGSDEVLSEIDRKTYVRIDEYLGEDWVDIMSNQWDLFEFNIFYDDALFSLETNYVYAYPLK